jgi:hypothetical protein
MHVDLVTPIPHLPDCQRPLQQLGNQQAHGSLQGHLAPQFGPIANQQHNNDLVCTSLSLFSTFEFIST